MLTVVREDVNDDSNHIKMYCRTCTLAKGGSKFCNILGYFLLGSY